MYKKNEIKHCKKYHNRLNKVIRVGAKMKPAYCCCCYYYYLFPKDKSKFH